MELWIRTQNREALVKTNIIKWENGCLRGATDEDGWYQELGKYKKKRALEVLDEIQRILHPILFLSAEINTGDNNWVENGIMYQKYKDNYSIQELSTYVYEMPKE